MAMSMRSGQIISRRFIFNVPNREHGEAAIRLWKRIFYFVSLPAIMICGINCAMHEIEERKHPHRMEYIPYEYLGKRTKLYPWGDGNHTLFHNPKKNPLPGIGYEE